MSHLPCVLFEDEHLLVVAKPAGLNTHAPAPFAGEGIYDWLRHREPRWATLATIHRLDKDTSGVMVFAKTALANRSLTEQFATRQVRKRYLLLTDRPLPRLPLNVVSDLVRTGDRYASLPERRSPARPQIETGVRAETHFSGAGTASGEPRLRLISAEPLTGRTHQIRVHAAENGFPILGDTLYGGGPARRLCLHAAELSFWHPATRAPLAFTSRADFDADPGLALRSALLDPAETDAFRILHGAADGWPGWQVDRLGNCLLSQSEPPLHARQQAELRRLAEACAVPTAYHKIHRRRVRQTTTAEASPQLVFGPPAPERFTIRENGVQFELSFTEGYSVGLFLDQRDNRRRFLTGHVAGGFPLATSHRPLEMLNVFAYTCGFSVCAALAGTRTTSLDLSKKYLDWGRQNFSLNGLDPVAHDFIFGDAFDWLSRLVKKGRRFDVIALDPPTFAQSRESGIWQAERHYGRLVSAALPLLNPGGVLFASTNAADWKPEAFLAAIHAALRAGGRAVKQEHYYPQPPDFPATRNEPAYLKTAWFRVA